MTELDKCFLYKHGSPGGYSNGGGNLNNGFSLNACGFKGGGTVSNGHVASPDILSFVPGGGLGLVLPDFLTDSITCNNFFYILLSLIR